MCGIAGIIDFTRQRDQADCLKAMMRAQEHRGPDGNGVYSHDGLLLGHCRLSILDLSPAGHQPMQYKNLTITYNGEIYNYLEVKQSLVELGHCFETHSDTEVILHAFEQWGADCLERFRGMWAFAIHDCCTQLLFCSRDRFGVKPFYYCENNGRFIFASEIKAILAASVEAKADPEMLMAYLLPGFTEHGKHTFFSGIYQILPGHNLEIDLNTGVKRFDHYYDLDTLGFTDSFAVNDISNYVEESVKFHLRSDVPVGTCLSGGLDSSLIAALASKELGLCSQMKLSAVTAKSELSSNDETSYAQLVVQHCNLDWHIAYPLYEDFNQSVEECLRCQDEPVLGPSVFMQYWVMKRAKEAGLKVMLDGQGGDEIFLGYERYYPAFFSLLLKNGHWGTVVKEYFLAARNSRLNIKSLLMYTIYFSTPFLRRLVLSRRGVFLKKKYLDMGLNALKGSTDYNGGLRSMQISELAKYQLPHLLKYEDRNSMAHSIEARVPYIDHKVVEAALSLSGINMIMGGFTKYPLRLLAEKLLPNEIAWRRNKYGFEAPEKKWLALHHNIMRETIAASLIVKEICKDPIKAHYKRDDTIWKLYNIGVWERLYNVSI